MRLTDSNCDAAKRRTPMPRRGDALWAVAIRAHSAGEQEGYT
jgi:hypothetical protein